jgi:hypothetical protein
MNVRVACLFLFFAVILAKPLLPTLPDTVEEINEELAGRYFRDFLVAFQKTYSNEEYVQRYVIFKENLKRTVQMNIDHGSPVFGITKFSDLTPEEFRNSYLNFRPLPRNSSQVVVAQPVGEPLDSIDWRTKGAVTAVKDQGQCGSCWAFSATEEVESMWFLANHPLGELSPQQVVSCDKTDGGCNGGDTITAYAYIKKDGLESEATYPYKSGNTGANGVCRYNANSVVARITGYVYATKPCTDSCNNQDETTLQNNLSTKGPVSICVDAESWQFYNGGVLKRGCPHGYNDLDHCVQLVGFENNYWIVRNSWNTDWGIQGYIHIQQGSNLCGIADEATIVTI